MDFPHLETLGSNEEDIDNPPHMNNIVLASSWAASPTSNSSPRDGTATRVSKRRRRRKSRAKPKVPVTQLSANKLNFKDIVHQFTGNYTAAANFRMDASPCNLPAVVDADIAFSQSKVLLARLAHSLRIVDTICAHFLLYGSPIKRQNQLHNSCKSLTQAPTSVTSEGQGSSLKIASQNKATSDLNLLSASHGLQPISPTDASVHYEKVETKRELSPAHMLDVDLEYKAQELEKFLLSGN